MLISHVEGLAVDFISMEFTSFTDELSLFDDIRLKVFMLNAFLFWADGLCIKCSF